MEIYDPEIQKSNLSLEKYQIARTIKIHDGYKECINNPMMYTIFGKYQYIFTDKENENEISLIELFVPCYCWEIFCIKGNIFEDVERFSTYRKAEKAIEKYLGKEYKN